MTESMITVGLHGQQQLKDELLVATSGNVSQPTLGATAVFLALTTLRSFGYL